MISNSDQLIEAKLQSTRFYDKIEAIERISQVIREKQDIIFINSIILKIADFYSSPETTNKLRSHIVKELISKCHKILEQHVFNKEEFTTRVSQPLTSNDPQSRMITLKMFSYLPSFIQNRLDIQHQILHLLTTTQNEQERLVANQTISMISSGSEIFAKSIMNKVEETILSGKFSMDTCCHLITAISNVSGDSNTAFAFHQTITELYCNMKSDELDPTLVRSLLIMTLKAPVILEQSLKFLHEISCYEGIEIISRKFAINQELIDSISNQASNLAEATWMIKIAANQYYKFGNRKFKEIVHNHQGMKNEILLQLSTSLLNDPKDKFTLNQVIMILEADPSLIEIINKDQTLILYIGVIENKRLNNLYKKLIKALEIKIDVQSLINSQPLSLITAKAIFYHLQSNPVQQLIQSFLKRLLDSEIDCKMQILNNYLKHFHHLIDLDQIITSLLNKDQIHLVFTYLLKFVCTQPYYYLLKNIIRKLLESIQDSYNNDITFPYIQMVYKYLDMLTSFDPIDVKMQRAFDLQMLCINVASKVEFVGKELFEHKDLVQNDGTNDPYKHFFIFQYMKLINTAIELKLMVQLEQSSLDNDINDQVQSINQQIAYIKKVHYINIARDKISLDNLDSLFNEIPSQIFSLRIPLFMNIQLLLEDYNKVPQEFISVRKEYDYMARILLKLSDVNKYSKLVSYVILNLYLIQNHGQTFNMQSSDIVFQEQIIINTKNGMAKSLFQLKFPTIGQYMVRIQAKPMTIKDQQIGIETVKNIKFSID